MLVNVHVGVQFSLRNLFLVGIRAQRTLASLGISADVLSVLGRLVSSLGRVNETTRRVGF